MEGLNLSGDELVSNLVTDVTNCYEKMADESLVNGSVALAAPFWDYSRDNMYVCTRSCVGF